MGAKEAEKEGGEREGIDLYCRREQGGKIEQVAAAARENN